MNLFEEMVALAEAWANINSHSKNSEGISKLLDKVEPAFAKLKPDELKRISFANGEGLYLKKRASSAPLRIFFSGHLDTVFPVDHPFQKVTYLNDRLLQGPGIADMKGGLVILLKALEAFEKTDAACEIGWEILLNPDEEIGSPSSTSLIKQCGKKADLALVFEPTFADGSLVSSRKGSANFRAQAKGKTAHAGRDPEKGKNAIYTLCKFIAEIEKYNTPQKGISLNVGVIQGGEALNIIPDFAECLINLRTPAFKSMTEIENRILEAAEKYGVKVQKTTFRSPKELDARTQILMNGIEKCAKKCGRKIKWKSSGGVTDGNTLAALGVPTLDSMGARGGNLHTSQEFIYLESLIQGQELLLEFLTALSSEQIKLPSRRKKR